MINKDKESDGMVLNWKNQIIGFLADKNIIILGFGLEGKSIYKFIRENLKNKEITIADKNDITEHEIFEELNDNKYNINFVIGEEYLNNLNNYDLILKSPGISFKNIDYSEFENKIYSQIDLFLKFFPGLTIGITGTKGKSTVSSLFKSVFEEANIKSYLLGNIGNAIFDEIENINKEDIIIIELSSHALQFMKESTNISVILNIFSEHLDHYRSEEEYIEAKFNFFRNFDNDKIFDEDLRNFKIIGCLTDLMKRSVYDIEHKIEEGEIINLDEKLNEIIVPELKILGEHNINNAKLVKYILLEYGLDEIEINNGLEKFNGLPHRLEYITEINNIRYYNDSISTIPQATIECIRAISDLETLILGGNNRGIDYSGLINYLNFGIHEDKKIEKANLKNIILLPNTGHMFYENLDNKKYNLFKVEDVAQAVNLSKEITEKGSVALSPAASSYGFYTNFIERGNVFKDQVLQLKN